MDWVLKKKALPGVYLARETGLLSEIPLGTVMDIPRLSLCLSGRAGYRLKRGGVASEVWLNPREVIFALPECFMSPHPAATYESLGIVFHRGFTRFLHATQKGSRAPNAEAKRRHRIQRAHHAAGVLSQDGRAFCFALNRAEAAPPRDRYVTRLMELLLLKTMDALRQGGAPPRGKAFMAWQAACHYMREHCHEPIGREEVAAFLDLHPNHLSRLFARFGDRSFNAYLAQARLSRAQSLLNDAKLTVEQVARMAGFSGANYFIRLYRRRYGATPGEARSAHHVRGA